MDTSPLGRMVISIFCFSAIRASPLRHAQLDGAVRLDLLLVHGEALRGHFLLHLVVRVPLDDALGDLLLRLVGLFLDAPPVGDQLVGAFLGELQADVVALRRLDLRLGGERGALPPAHLDQLVVGGLFELDVQVRERELQAGEIVDLRLDLREVAHGAFPPPASMSSARAPAFSSRWKSEEAGRARVRHQVRRVATFSFMVRDSGTVSAIEWSTPSVVRTPADPWRSYSSNKALTTACSISAPVNPSDFSAILSRSNCEGSRPRRLTWMAPISLRSGRVGKSTKKISSKRPLRIISGGSSSTLLAVAITNTGLVFSCSQVMKLPKTRAAVPASDWLEDPVPEKPFSSSSTQRIDGATASAIWMARRMFSSEDPTMPAKTLPTSRRKSGSRQEAPTALAVSDLPPPGMPIMRMPLGRGSPNLRASSMKALWRFFSQVLSWSRPPMFSICSCERKNSSTPLLRTMRSFSLRITSMSKVPVCTSDLAKTFSASSAVSPSAASMTCSRSCPPGGALLGTMLSTRSRMVPISANSGSGYSTTAISLSHSGGMTSTGEMRKAVLSVSFRLRPRSRSSRTTSGFLVKACRSRRMKTALSSFFASSTKRSALSGSLESPWGSAPRRTPSVTLQVYTLVLTPLSRSRLCKTRRMDSSTRFSSELRM